MKSEVRSRKGHSCVRMQSEVAKDIHSCVRMQSEVRSFLDILLTER